MSSASSSVSTPTKEVFKNYTFTYSGQVEGPAKLHLDLLRKFKRLPTVDEFKVLFNENPILIPEFMWPNEVDLTGCLDGFKNLHYAQKVTIVSKMIGHKMVASDIGPYLDEIELKHGNTKFVRKMRSYFGSTNVVDDTKEFTDAVFHFHQTGELATGLAHQELYDAYIHSIMSNVIEDEENMEKIEVTLSAIAEE